MFLPTVVIVVIIILDIIVYYFRQLHQDDEEEDYVTRNNSSASPSSSSQHYCRRIPLAEIKKATHNFDASMVIGKGGFGKVYKGNIIIHNGNGETCAFKRLDLGSSQGAPEFWTEIEMLSKFRHGHLVSLIGYCDEEKEMILVYEYMAGGTLHDHLHKISGASGGSNCPLSWVQRLKICIGAARGLDYLHTGTSIQHRVIHRDVKSSNILLDENLEAKLSDFGLSKLGPANQPSTHVSTQVKGTFGYLDPEYFLTRRLTRKSDVYAFGVLLFEVLCGRLTVDTKLDQEQWSLASWAKQCIKDGTLDQITDQTLKGGIRPNCLKAFVQTAEHCLKNNSKKRPTMGEIVIRLELALALQEGLNSSVLEEEIINTDRDKSRDNQENSSQEHNVNNANDGGEEQIEGSMQLGHAGSEQSRIRSSRKMKFMKMVRSLFSARAPSVSVRIMDMEGRKRLLKEKFHTDVDDITTESLQFDFAAIKTATNHFSYSNKLGDGGFGAVYKGRLQNGQDIAVKRLAKDSRQGEFEFKNEVLLMARLQHRNLVRLLGFSLEGTERLLIFEFVPNAGLDLFLFDLTKRANLDWEKRYKIIRGVTRGLVYVHEDSRLRIIDLKASNVLLDANMNPKIADFGMARLLRADETQGNNWRIVGTYGYMAPEYAMPGQFSVKSDVFSFGVLVLEIATGQKSRCFINGETPEDLLTYAWKNWREGTASSIIDPTLRAAGSGSMQEMMKCIHIGLLCIQENIRDRPTMASVELMLNSFSLTLPVPSEPGFFMHSSTNLETPLLSESSMSSDGNYSTKSKSRSVACSIDDDPITELEPR